MHLQVCVGACCEVLSLARWTNQQAFFMSGFYFKTILTLLLSNLLCNFYSPIRIFSISDPLKKRELNES
jgi:hypothetical protein